MNSRERMMVLLLGVLLLAGAAWWWFRGAAVEPPLPANVQDPEVLRVLEAARQEVRDHPRSAAAWAWHRPATRTCA